jgi:phosphate-selective porin
MLKRTKIAVTIAGLLGVTSFSAIADGVPGGSMQNNPAFNVVLEGRYVDQDESHFSLPGFQAHDSFEHLGVYENGFSAGHNEINMGGTINDDISGVISFALESHDGESSVDLEEAYVESESLGNGVTVKAGQFYSHIGILNTLHEHRQDFANASLVYIGMFAGHLSNTGVQLRWEQAGDFNIN